MFCRWTKHIESFLNIVTNVPFVFETRFFFLREKLNKFVGGITQEDGLLLLMVHMRGDIATSKKKGIHRIIALQTSSGHALLVKSTSVEAPFKFPSK